MATVNFLYRSNKEAAFLNLRLLYRQNEKDFVVGVKTKCNVTKEYWNKVHKKERLRDAEEIEEKANTTKELNNLRKEVMSCFNVANHNEINKEWLQSVLDQYYNPILPKEPITDKLLPYIDYFLERKKNDVTHSTIKKYNVVKQLLNRYQENRKRILLIKDIDFDFKHDFESYCLEENYSPNTTARAIKTIKTFCTHANKYNNIEVSETLDLIKTKYVKVDHIHLTKEDLIKLESLNDKNIPEYLSNAKDWLLISCYTGQRVSDFMRFTKNMIVLQENRKREQIPCISFTQVKTGKEMYIPLQSKVTAILNKRNEDFPRAISDQKYNEYIKEVCKTAGINKEVNGSKKTLIDPEEGKYRKQTGKFKKYELVSSHIGRRTFATLNYSKIPTSLLKEFTGHSTEKMLLEYIGKAKKDFAMDIMEYLDN